MADIGTLECGFALIDNTSDKVFTNLDKRVANFQKKMEKAGTFNEANFTGFNQMVDRMVKKYNDAVLQLNGIAENRKVSPKLIDEGEYQSAVKKVEALKQHLDSLLSLKGADLGKMINMSSLQQSFSQTFDGALKSFNDSASRLKMPSIIDRGTNQELAEFEKRLKALQLAFMKTTPGAIGDFTKFENVLTRIISMYNTATRELENVGKVHKIAPSLINESDFAAATMKVRDLRSQLEAIFAMSGKPLSDLITTPSLRESRRVAFMSQFKMYEDFNEGNNIAARAALRTAARNEAKSAMLSGSGEIASDDKDRLLAELKILEQLSKAWDELTKAKRGYEAANGSRTMNPEDTAMLTNLINLRKKIGDAMKDPFAMGAIENRTMLLGADKNLLLDQTRARTREIEKENAKIADGVTARTKQELKDNETRKQSLRILEDEYRKLHTAMEAAKMTKLAPDMDASRINLSISRIKQELQEINLLKKLISNGSTMDISGVRVRRENLLGELGLNRREDTIARSQYETLQNKYAEIAAARQRLTDAQPFAQNDLERSAILSKIKALDDYKAKLESIKLGTNNALRDENGASLVGSQLKNLLAEAKSFAGEIVNGYKTATKEADVFSQQTEKAKNKIAELKATSDRLGEIKNLANTNGFTDIANGAAQAQREINAVIKEWDSWKSKIAMGTQMKSADFTKMAGIEAAAMRGVKGFEQMSNNIKMLEGRLQSLQTMRDNAQRTIGDLKIRGVDTTEAERKLKGVIDLIAKYNNIKLDPSKVAKIDGTQIATEYKTVTGELTRVLPAIKEIEKARKEEAATNRYVEDTIRKLNNAYATSGNKKYVAGVDTSRLQSARQDIADFIAIIKDMQRNGEKVSVPEVRIFRKDMLSELRMATSQTNAAESQLMREQKQAETLEKKYQELKATKDRLDSAKTGASSSDIANLDAQIKKLDDYERRLRGLKLGSKDSLLDANGLSLVGSQLNQLIRESEGLAKSVSGAVKSANKEFNDFDKQTERCNLEIQRLQNNLAKIDAFQTDALSKGFVNAASSAGTAKSQMEALIASWGQWKNTIAGGQLMTPADYLRMSNDRMKAVGQFDKAKIDYKNESAAANAESRAAKQRERDNEKYLSQLNTIIGVIAKLKRERAELNQNIGRASNLGIDTTAARKSLDEINKKIDFYNNLLKTTPKETVISMTFRSNDNINVLNGAKKATSDLRGAIKDAENAKKSDAKTTQSLVKEYERLTNAANKSGQALEKMKNLAMQFAPVYGLQQLVMSIIEVGGEIEKQHIALQAIIGDIQEANAMFAQIKNLALESPFTFGELNRDVKQLAAYSYEYEELYDTTKRLADLAAGLGVSFERIALAMGQTKSRGFLDGKELRQFAYAGIPLLAKLSDMYTKTRGQTVTTSQVKKMVSQNKVSYEDVQKVLWDMTDAGGQFYNMQITLSETLYGRWNKLKDAWEIMLSEFASGDSIVGKTMKTILNGITAIVLGLNKSTFAVQGLIAAFAAVKFSNLGGGRQMGQNILAIQKKAAADLTAKAAMGETLTPMQKSIIANQNQITRSTLQTLITNKAINETQLRQLYASGQINKSLYRSVAATNGWAVSATRVTAQFRLMGVAVGGAMSKVVNGLKSFISGNWVSLAIGAITAVAMYWVEKYQEIERAAKKSSDEALDKLKQLKDFSASINVEFVINSGDSSKIDDVIEQFKDKIKDIAPTAYYDIMFRMEEDPNIKTNADRLKFLNNEVKLLKEGMEMASETSKTFFKSIEDANGWATEDVKSNIVDYVNAVHEFKQDVDKIDFNTLAKGFKQLSFSQDGKIRAMANEMKKMYENGASLEELLGRLQEYSLRPIEYDAKTNTFSGDYAGAISAIFGKDILKGRNAIYTAEQNLLPQIKQIAQDLKKEWGDEFAKNPLKRTAYKSLVESAVTQMELTPEQADIFRIKLNTEVGVSNADVYKEKFADELRNTLPGEIKLKAWLGQKLEGESKKVAEDCAKKAIEAVKAKFPEQASEIQQMLDDKQFTATVLLNYVEGEKPATTEQQAVATSVPFTELTEKDRAWITNNTKGDAYASKEYRHKTIDELYRKRNAAREDAKNRPSALREQLAKQAEEEYQYYLSQSDRFYGDKYTGKEKGRQGSHKDAIAEEWRRRLSLLKEYEAEYNKFSKQTEKGASGAVDYLSQASNGDWRKMLGDFMGRDLNMKNPEQMIKTYFEKNINGRAKTDMQKEETKRWIKEITDIHYRIASEAYKQDLEVLKKFISEATEDYDTYHNLLLAGVSGKDAAAMTVGGNGAEVLSRLEMLYSKLSAYTTDKDVKAISTATDDQLFARYDKNWQAVKAIATEIYNNQRQARKDGLTAVSETLKKMNSVADKTARIAAEYDDIVRKINEGAMARWKEENPNGDISKAVITYTPEEQHAIDVATADKNLKLVEVSSEYIGAMDAAIAYSSEELTSFSNNYLKALGDAFRNGTITAKEYKDKVQAIDDVMRKSKNAFNIFNLKKSGLQGILEKFREKYSSEEMRHTLDAQDANKSGDITTAREEEEAAEMAGRQVETMTNLIEVLERVGTSIEAMNEFMQGISAAFNKINALQMSMGGSDWSTTGIGQGITAFSEFSGELSSTWKSAFDLNPAGVISGAVGMITSPWTALNKAHDAKLEEQIKQNERMIKKQEWYYNQVLALLKESPAGMYSTKAANEVRLMTATAEGKSVAQLDAERRDREASQGYSTSPEHDRGYYAALKENLSSKQNLISENIAKELDKKDTDDEKVQEYRQQLADVEKQIRHLAKDIAKEFYGIDLTGWASNLSNALVDAWASGKNAAKAYGDTVRDIMRNVITNIIQQKVIGKYFEDEMDKWYSKFDSKGGVMDDDLWGDLLDIMVGGKSVIDKSYIMLDAANEAFTKATGSSLKGRVTGMTPSIAGVTEDTADLLASYIDGIRADVSMERRLMENIDKNVELISQWNLGDEEERIDTQHARVKATTGDMIPTSDDTYMSSYMMAIHEEAVRNNSYIQSLVEEQIPNVSNQLAMQLAEMKRIEMNTHRSADASEDIRDMLNSLTNGSGAKKMSIAMS